MYTVSAIFKNFSISEKNLLAQRLMFPDPVNFWKSDKNCGHDPKKKSGTPKKTLCIYNMHTRFETYFLVQ